MTAVSELSIDRDRLLTTTANLHLLRIKLADIVQLNGGPGNVVDPLGNVVDVLESIQQSTGPQGVELQDLFDDAESSFFGSSPIWPSRVRTRSEDGFGELLSGLVPDKLRASSTGNDIQIAGESSDLAEDSNMIETSGLSAEHRFSDSGAKIERSERLADIDQMVFRSEPFSGVEFMVDDTPEEKTASEDAWLLQSDGKSYSSGPVAAGSISSAAISMNAVGELTIYRDRLLTTTANLESLRLKLTDIAEFADDLGDVIDPLGDIADTVKFIRQAVEDQLLVLKFTKQVGPLSVPSKLFEQVLKAVKPVIVKIDDAIAKIRGKQDANDDDGNPDGQDDFLDKMSNALDAINTTLTMAADKIQTQEDRLNNTETSIIAFIDALDRVSELEASDPNFFNGAFDGLEMDVAGQIGQRNALTGDIVDTFNSIVSRIDAMLGIFTDAKLAVTSAATKALDDIFGFLDVIASPLKIAAAIFKPIRPLLDAIGFIFDLVVQPVIDFVLDTLGINDLLDKVRSEIQALLPDFDFLDPFIDQAQAILDEMRELRDTAFGIFAVTVGQPDFIDDIEDKFYGATVGFSLLGPTGIGDESDELLIGDAPDDILDAQAGDDQIFGNEGNDIILASEGDDIADGGDGVDMIHFSGFFDEYSFVKGDDGRVTVTHEDPASGAKNEGSEKLIDIEHVIFRNITFTGQELEEAIIEGSPAEGTSGDDLILLQLGGVLNSNGLHEARGFAGNDRIFGTTEGDELFGGGGDDIFVPGGGADFVRGGNGTDTFQVLLGPSSFNHRINLFDGTNFGGFGDSDQLFSIESIIVQNSGDHRIVGDNLPNSIISGGGDDVITGAGGNDVIVGGGGNDVMFGGQGRDSLSGGAENDFLVVGGSSVAGRTEHHDGGIGFDALSYSLENDIIFDVQGLGSEPDKRNAINDAIATTTAASGAVRILAGQEMVEHLNATGQVIATDTFENIEILVGSDLDDEIHGTLGIFGDRRDIRGAHGDDTMFSNGASRVFGDDGDDIIHVTQAPNGSFGSSPNYDGGAGIDTLDLTAFGTVRWWFDLEGAISRSIRASDESRVGNLRSGGGTLFSANVENFEVFILGDGDHLIENAPGGSTTRTFFTGSGDDELFAEGGFSIFRSGAGNDIATFNGDSGEFFAGAGDDRVLLDDTGEQNKAVMGKGNDYALMERMEGMADGGEGTDTLAFDILNNSHVDVDLIAGTALSTGIDSNGFTVNRVDAVISGFEQIIGTDFNDTLAGHAGTDEFVGRAGNDLLQGRDGDDRLFGGDGNDTIQGGAGNDTLHGGGGNDIIQGGSGNDTASYDYARPGGLEGDLAAGNFGGQSVDLLTGTATGSFGTDTLMAINNVFGSDGNDNLLGNDGQNVLSGEDGNDVLNGRVGNDVLILGEGNDTAIGGSGDDLIILGTGTSDIMGGSGFDTFDLGAVTGSIDIDMVTDSFTAMFDHDVPVWADTGTAEIRVFNAQNLTPQLVREADPSFSNSADDVSRVLPDPSDPDFFMFLTVDQVQQFAGFGTFVGIDEIVGGLTSVNLRPSLGVDRFDGSLSMNDVIDFSAETMRVSYDLATGASNSALVAGDDLVGLEGVTGGQGNDELSGDGGDNKLIGNGGNDDLFGRAGHDEILGSAGDDFIGGAGGNDKLFGGANSDNLRGGDGRDMLKGGADDDTLVGGNGPDTLEGGTGNDSLLGENGDDDLFGEGGHDVLTGGAGADMLNGGGGIDAVSYETAASGVTADLDNAASNSGEASGDSFVSIENMFGSNFADNLRGNSADNQINGGSGMDNLFGRGGDDVLIGGGGQDALNGGGGRNAASYVGATSGVLADLVNSASNSGQATGDSYTSIQDLIGTDHDDDLRGDAAGNQLAGGSGVDTLSGRGGSDDLFGGGGNDILLGGGGGDMLNGGQGLDIASYKFANAKVTVDLNTPGVNTGEAAGDSYSGIEGLTGSDFNDILRGTSGDDVIDGGTGSDELFGRAGNDVLIGDFGGDVLNGGTGFDTASYRTSAIGVNVDLNNPAANTGPASGDSYVGIEAIEGSAFNDDLRGTAGDDTILGGSGHDGLFGRAGDDVLVGGFGSDTLNGGDGSDTASYVTATKAVIADLDMSAANAGQASGDNYISVENLEGSLFDDSLRGDSSGNSLTGKAGDDNLFGRGGHDILAGNAGNDMLNGGGGNDTFVFGNGFGTDQIVGLSAADDEKIDLSAVSAINHFFDLVNNHLQSDAGTGFALIVVGSNSILLERRHNGAIRRRP